jgi:RNA-directed DNA polymerase
VRDGVVLRLIGKWLNAGVLEEGVLTNPEAGTPQGGVVSPLLSNLFLHYVLDEWFEQEVRPRLKGEAFLIRYADDCAPRRCERTTSGVSLNAMLCER